MPASGRIVPSRCSVRSEAIDEPMFATASTVRSWLLIEHGGPWGVHALEDARLRPSTRVALVDYEERLGVRVLLIRRPSAVAARDRGVTCFAIRSVPERPWIERAELARLDEVVDVDVVALSNGSTTGMDPTDEPVILVCTHGRHDPCCAERGRPLARALAASEPDATWESSHVGGDRFAGNVVAFPHGVYFGRVAPDAAGAVVAAYRRGRIDLAHHRGRSCYSTPVQAAEHLFRVEHAIDRIDDVHPVAAVRVDGRFVVTLLVEGSRRFDVTVERLRLEPRALTCRGTEPFAAPAHRLVSIDPAA